MMFVDETAPGLALGLMAAQSLSLSGVALAIEGGLSKLERSTLKALRERVSMLEETVTTAAASPAARASGEIAAILAAARDGRRVRVRYRSGLQVETEREVNTYATIRKEGYWDAVGYDHLRKAMRLFRIARVLDAEPLEATFERRPPSTLRNACPALWPPCPTIVG